MEREVMAWVCEEGVERRSEAEGVYVAVGELESESLGVSRSQRRTVESAPPETRYRPAWRSIARTLTPALWAYISRDSRGLDPCSCPAEDEFLGLFEGKEVSGGATVVTAN